jgi:hypothetical protein
MPSKVCSRAGDAKGREVDRERGRRGRGTRLKQNTCRLHSKNTNQSSESVNLGAKAELLFALHETA